MQEANPRDVTQAALATVDAALRTDRIDAAIAAAEAGIARGAAHPLLFNLAAYQRQVDGRFADAMLLLEQARRLAPDDVFILCAIGSCLSQQGLEAQALEIYDQALRLNPRHAPAHHGRGLALSALGEQALSLNAHLDAVAVAPAYPDALGALADHAIRRGETEAGTDYARRALAADPDEPAATLALAFVDFRQGRYDDVVTRLRARLDRGRLSPFHVSALEGLCADALDRLERTAEAFEAYVSSNRAMLQVHQPLMSQAGVELGVDLCRRLLAAFETQDGDWRPAASANAATRAGPPDAHVFLIGFVRSGTTLLEQVLASHPRVVALEEPPLLRGLSQGFFKSAAALDRLARLDAETADALRADYWRGVREAGVEPSGRVFVDKNPLDGVWMPMIAKLFPSAKILIARRDPRDVVISSFRHRFIVNVLTTAFTDLHSTAAFYSAVMALTEHYRTRLPVEAHIHRHEDLVARFDQVVGEICAFVGLEWSDALRDFAATARARDIRTPSAEQVRRGLSDEGLGRWRRYGPQMAPVLPILQPWVEAFGYAP